MSKKYTNTGNPMFGKHHSEEFKAIRKKLYSGKGNPNYGNGNKIVGHRNPFFGKIHSEQTKQKMRDAKFRNNTMDVKTYKFKNTIYLEEFIGYRFEFYKKYKLSPAAVRALLIGKRKAIKGWIFLGEVI